MTCKRCGHPAKLYAHSRKWRWYYCDNCGQGYGVSRMDATDVRAFNVTDTVTERYA